MPRYHDQGPAETRLFLNEDKSLYVSVGFYPTNQVLAEFGGPQISPITLTEQHVKTLVEHLPALCEAMYRGEHYACKDGSLRLQSSGTHTTARIYRDKKCVSFKLVHIRYMINILHFVHFQKTNISLRKMMLWLLPF